MPEPSFTHEQLLVERGARLVLSDGCTGCHLSSAGTGVAPSFSHLAGHRVTLTDGRSVLVDEQLIAEALRHPANVAIRGYDAKGMVQAVARAHPDRAEIADLAAFIEQIGPE